MVYLKQIILLVGCYFKFTLKNIDYWLDTKICVNTQFSLFDKLLTIKAETVDPRKLKLAPLHGTSSRKEDFFKTLL